MDKSQTVCEATDTLREIITALPHSERKTLFMAQLGWFRKELLADIGEKAFDQRMGLMDKRHIAAKLTRELAGK